MSLSSSVILFVAASGLVKAAELGYAPTSFFYASEYIYIIIVGWGLGSFFIALGQDKNNRIQEDDDENSVIEEEPDFLESEEDEDDGPAPETKQKKRHPRKTKKIVHSARQKPIARKVVEEDEDEAEDVNDVEDYLDSSTGESVLLDMDLLYVPNVVPDPHTTGVNGNGEKEHEEAVIEENEEPSQQSQEKDPEDIKVVLIPEPNPATEVKALDFSDLVAPAPSPTPSPVQPEPQPRPNQIAFDLPPVKKSAQATPAIDKTQKRKFVVDEFITEWQNAEPIIKYDILENAQRNLVICEGYTMLKCTSVKVENKYYSMQSVDEFMVNKGDKIICSYGFRFRKINREVELKPLTRLHEIGENLHTSNLSDIMLHGELVYLVFTAKDSRYVKFSDLTISMYIHP